MHGGWEVIHKDCAPVLGGCAMDAAVKGCGLLVERMMSRLKNFEAQIVSSRWSPEFAGAPPRAPAKPRCVCAVLLGGSRMDHMESSKIS